jgi:hypothetical protein
VHRSRESVSPPRSRVPARPAPSARRKTPGVKRTARGAKTASRSKARPGKTPVRAQKRK